MQNLSIGEQFVFINENLPGVLWEQGNQVNFTIGTREQSEKQLGNKGLSLTISLCIISQYNLVLANVEDMNL